METEIKGMQDSGTEQMGYYAELQHDLEAEIDRQTDRQRGRQTERERERQRDRETKTDRAKFRQHPAHPRPVCKIKT